MSLESKEFPKHWSVVPIESVVFFQEGPGVRKYQYTSSGVKLLNGGNINDGILNLDTTERYISQDEAYGKYNHFLVEDGDLLIACSGVVVDKFEGKIAYARKEHLPLCMNTSTMRFKPLDSNTLEIDYFRRFLATNFFKKQLQKLITGSAQLNFGPSHIQQMEIQLPPIAEQKRIAAILDKADTLRRKRQQSILLADQFLRSVFLELFGDSEHKGWEFYTVEEVAENTKGSMRTGPFGSQLLHSEFTEDGISVLGIDNAVKNKFRWAKPRFISESKYESLKKFTVKPEDVLITIMGTCGRCAIVPKGCPTSINTKHLCCITLDQKKCLPSFLHSYFLQHPTARKYLAKNSKGAVMDGLNMGIIKNMPIFLPPMDIQLKYAEICNQVETLKNKLESSKSDSIDCFASLSQKAFVGEL